MADSTEIDGALLTRLIDDATLTSYCPDGVWWDEAKAGAKRFVIVSLVDEADVPMLGSRAYEDALYLVKAVMLNSLGVNIGLAAKRIEDLLENTLIEIDGYRTMTLHREARIRITEVDDIDPSIRWLHRGGHYRLAASATTDAEAPAFDTDAFA